MFRSSKEAQHEAAKVAVEHFSSLGESDLSNILLQLWVEKEDLVSPLYKSKINLQP
ncbi:hypothetical protein C1H46_032367 [Malus baccata]|uniref:Uncharacterized protein n=1 Tax=Malus baccata TaxID=106549 RepID=A0A540L6X1_MALBA|nr:hypothetical protein C1H46_032367 [Malus baccata]